MRQYETYKTDYYTGVNVAIFCNGVWVDEAVSIDFTEQTEVLPLFGYSSYVYDELVIGRRMVSGSIVVNFTKSEYINAILKADNADKATQSKIITDSTILNDINKFIESSTEEQLDEYIQQLESKIWGSNANSAINNNLGIGMYGDNNLFDIVIKFNNSTCVKNNKNTSIKIIDAKLYTHNMSIEANDAPIVARYGFIAKTVIRS